MDLRSIDPKTLGKKPAPAPVQTAPVHHPAPKPKPTIREVESEEIESTPVEEERLVPAGMPAPEPEEEEQQEITMSPEEANQLSARIEGLEKTVEQLQIECASLGEVNATLSNQLGHSLLRGKQLENALGQYQQALARYQQPKKG
jgi:hypothetical protein